MTVRRVTITPNPDGTFDAVWTLRTFRYLLSDGRTVDVNAPHDSSDVREAVLEHFGVAKVVGAALLPAQETLL